MNNGWIKLHRKLQESEIWNDANAWRVFQWILMNVDYKTGIGTFGRSQIAKGTGLKPNTAYKVTTRLHEKYQVLSMKSNNLYTEFRVLNWAKYQHDDEVVTATVTTPSHVTSKKSNTNKEYKEYKNIRIKRESTPEYLREFSIEDFSDIEATEKQIRLEAEKAENWLIANNRKKSNYKAFLRNWVLKVYKKRVASLPSVEYEYDQNGLARVAELKKNLMTIKTMDHPAMTDFDVNDRRNLLLQQAKELKN